jgi:hypothetical protein
VRYPYERFLRFLVSRKVEVNQALSRFGLPPVGGLWTASCRTTFRESAPYSIVRHLDSSDTTLLTTDGVLDWAETEGFRALWDAQPEFAGSMSRELDVALRIFASPRARIRMGLFLFSKATPSEIVDVTREHFDMEIGPSIVELYRRVFWDAQSMTRRSWEILFESMEKEERHYLALGLDNPTLDGVKCILGMKYSLEPDAVLRRLMVTSIEQYDTLMKQPIPSPDALRWAEMAKSAAVALAAHVPKKSAEPGLPTDFGGLFTVQISKSNHVSLADLQGQVGTPEPSKPTEGT